MAPKGPDEGAMIEFLRLTMGALLRRQSRVSPCGARYFPGDGKVPKGSPGDAADGHFVPIGPPPYPLCRFTTSPPDRGSRPPVPRCGSYSLSQAESFRRAKSEWPPRFLPAHWGLVWWKITAAAVPPPRLALPIRCSRCWAVGRDDLGAPLGVVSQIHCRGGCPHPPAYCLNALS